MKHIDGPFELLQDCENSLVIVNEDGQILCQFLEEVENTVSESTIANASFVLKAITEYLNKENER